MSNINLTRNLGEPIKLTAPGGYEATIIVKSCVNGRMEVFITAPPAIKVSRPDPDGDEYDKLDAEDKAMLDRWLRK